MCVVEVARESRLGCPCMHGSGGSNACVTGRAWSLSERRAVAFERAAVSASAPPLQGITL